MERIEILTVSGFVLVLCDGALNLFEPKTLNFKKTVIKSVTAFALRPDDQLAVATGRKVHLFTFNPTVADYAPYSMGKTAELAFADGVQQLGQVSC